MRISDWSSDVCSSDLRTGSWSRPVSPRAESVPHRAAPPFWRTDAGNRRRSYWDAFSRSESGGPPVARLAALLLAVGLVLVGCAREPAPDAEDRLILERAR